MSDALAFIDERIAFFKERVVRGRSTIASLLKKIATAENAVKNYESELSAFEKVRSEYSAWSGSQSPHAVDQHNDTTEPPASTGINISELLGEDDTDDATDSTDIKRYSGPSEAVRSVLAEHPDGMFVNDLLGVLVDSFESDYPDRRRLLTNTLGNMRRGGQIEETVREDRRFVRLLKT